MKLDYIENINEFGENVVRLYSANKSESIQLSNLIAETIVNKKKKLDLSQVDFIEMRNCNLILELFSADEGITSEDNETFYCSLSLESYKTILKLLKPFCEKETKSHQYLYDIDNPIDFLYSPSGSW